MSIGIISEDNNKYKKANNISLKNYLNSKNYSFIETNGKLNRRASDADEGPKADSRVGEENS